jgi:parvulin-like peptidyl-prolyl isomerase
MTFRTRSAPRPTRRRLRRNDSRRAVYITLVFTLAIASAVALMGGVFAASYYSDHQSTIATVNGEAISKDAVRARATLNIARHERQIADYTVLRNQGKITSDQFTTLVNPLTTAEAPSTVYSDALTQLTSEAELRQYAAKNNITITDQMVNDQIKTDSTIPELRHVVLIGVNTPPVPGATATTDADFSAAQAAAQSYYQELVDGKSWTDVAKDATDADRNHSGEDLGLATRDDLSVDPPLADAIFALKKVGDFTTVFKGSDGTYNIGEVTGIVPSYVDSSWESTVSAAGDYRGYALGEATKNAVGKAIEAKYIYAPVKQRHVEEISVDSGTGIPGDGDEVKLRMMIFAPNHSTSAASSVATTDPAWTDALTRAQKAVDTLRNDPSQWYKLAYDNTVNDDTIVSTLGGDLPWIPLDTFSATTLSQQSGLGMTNVGTAVFKDGLTPGILDPIQETSYGYMVIDFQGRRKAPDQRMYLTQFAIYNGADFATEAKTQSEAVNASSGGDMGWVSPYQLTTLENQAVFNTPVGSVSNMVTETGYHIYKILDEQTRTADPAQQVKLKNTVFKAWLADFQANQLVWQDQAALSAMAPASPT